MTIPSHISDVAGFENSKNDEFFGSFDAKAAQSGGGSDGFDAAALSSAWGDAVPSSETASAGDDGQSDGFDDAAFDTLDAEGDARKKEDSDKGRSSRRRQQGNRTSRSGRVEAGVEAMNMNDPENGDGDRRRGEDPRKRSSSKSRRKARERGSRTEK